MTSTEAPAVPCLAIFIQDIDPATYMEPEFQDYFTLLESPYEAAPDQPQSYLYTTNFELILDIVRKNQFFVCIIRPENDIIQQWMLKRLAPEAKRDTFLAELESFKRNGNITLNCATIALPSFRDEEPGFTRVIRTVLK